MSPKSRKRKRARRKACIMGARWETRVFALIEDQVANEVDMYAAILEVVRPTP